MSVNSIASRSITALFWGVGGAMGKIGGQLIVQITLARILGPESFGQFAVLLAVLSLGGVLADCGFGAALIQKKKITNADIELALGWSLSIAISSAICISLIASFLARQFGDESLTLMFTVSAFLIIPQAMGNLSTNLLQRELNMKSIQLIHVFSYLLCFGGVSTILALKGWGGWSLVIGYAVQTAFKVIATYAICRHTLRPRLWGDPALINFGLKSLSNDLSNWSLDNFDKFLIGKFWGLYPLGLYSVAFNLSKAPSALLVFATQNIAFSSASRLQDDLTVLRKGFQAVITIMALASLPLFAMVAFESTAVLNIIYGPKWIMAAPYMTALAIAIPLMSLGSITAAILRGTGAIGTELCVQISTICVFFGGLIFLRNLPLSMAVWTVPVAYAIRLILLLLVVRDRLNLSPKDLIVPFQGAIVLTTMGVVTTLFVHNLPYALSPAMGLLPLLTGCCMCIFLFLFKFTWFLGSPLSTIIHTKFSSGHAASIIGWLEKKDKKNV